MKKISVFIALFVLFAFFMPTYNVGNFAMAKKDESLNITSKAAILYDKKSGTIVYSKNSDKRLPIASMTKLASLMLILEALDNGKLKGEDVIKISNHAAETEGSSAFLDEGQEYSINDLIMTVIVCSANDSTVALAEAVAGSEDNFVKLLNKRVKEMGLENTNFINATGLPALDHYSSAEDISKIYLKICDHPIYKKYSKIWMTELKHNKANRKTDIVNTNRLIKTYEGCDSGKTGFTNDAGFCLAASATRRDMRLVGVVVGAESSKVRFNEMASLFDYGFNNYENRLVINCENPIYSVKVKNSIVKEVAVYPKSDYVKFLEKGEEFKFSIDYRVNKIKAPLKKGENVGKLFILNSNNIVIYEDDLIVKEDIKEIKVKDLIRKIYVQMP